MPHVQASTISTHTATLNTKVRALFETHAHWPHPDLVLDLERAIHDLARWWADSIFASWLAFLFAHTDFEDRVVLARRADSQRPLKSKGRRRVELKLLGGHCFSLSVRVLKASGQLGRPRGVGRRGTGKGHQATPALQALGFTRSSSPARAALTLAVSASAHSFEAARRAARTRGVKVSQRTWLNDFKSASSLAQRALDIWLQAPNSDSPLAGLSAAGKRIVVGFDGGRLRGRVDKRGRKKANGYRGFHADWVEPRQLVVHAIDEHGKREKSWGKFAHASLECPDALFKELTRLFGALELEKAECVVIAADGQHWQWKRMRKALVKAGVQGSRIIEVLDTSHALGRLNELSHLPAKWAPKSGARVGWYLKGRELLTRGDVDGLIEHCLTLAKGSRTKSVRKQTEYFEKHRERMAYAKFRNRGIPTGSGAVESMIRQVVNMRLKSSGKFWKRESAERMLMARSWWVTGRLEDLWRFTLRQEASWWNPSQDQCSCAFDCSPLFS